MMQKEQGRASISAILLVVILGAVSLAFLTGVPAYNKLQRLDEGISAAWSNVVNQYQRRADLVPNLVEVAKGYAAHEQEVFAQVTEARSRVGSVNVNVSEVDENTLKQYQAAQAQLSGALSRLIAVAENYPDLKANEVFQNLQVQLEGTENRIATARSDYIEAVREFNTTVRQFPTNFIAGFAGLAVKPNFTVENEAQISTAPKVQFGQ